MWLDTSVWAGMRDSLAQARRIPLPLPLAGLDALLLERLVLIDHVCAAHLP